MMVRPAQTWERWATAAQPAPLPLQPAWLAAEEGRVGGQTQLFMADSTMARAVLIESDEPRVGYTISDIVAGGRHMVPELAHGPTAFIGTFGAPLPAVVGSHRPDELAALTDDVAAWAADQGASGVAVGSVPHTAEWAGLRGALEQAGFLPVWQPPEAVLALSESGMTGVLARLSHSQRKNVRRQQDAFAAGGGRVEIGPAESLATAEHAELLAAHYGKFGHWATLADAQDRLARAAALPGALALSVVGDEGLRGLSVVALDRERSELYSRLSACRRDAVFSYFALVFYARIELATDHGLHLLHYGDESYGPKVQRGCHLVGRTTFVRPLGRAPSGLARRCADRSASNRARVETELPPRYLPLLADDALAGEWPAQFWAAGRVVGNG